MATLVSGVGWIVVVGVCAYFAWVARTRPILWPPDIEELLVQYRLARPSGRLVGAAGEGGIPFRPLAYIPFRPLTFGEIFGAASKIVTRNWTTLIGIPLFLCGTTFIVGSTVIMIAMKFLISAPGFTSLDSWLVVAVVIFWLLIFVVAFPADALLIALGVTATSKAVRGESVCLAEVFAAARSRMFAVCRLTGAYYALFAIIDTVVYGVVFTAYLTIGPGALALGIPIFIGTFILGIMISLAPIVLVVEGRGVMDSFRRAWQLAKLSWQRLFGIHLLWAVCITPLLLIPASIVTLALGFLGLMLFMSAGFAVLIAYFRTLQMLIYTDLRIRQERYDVELSAAWSQNTGTA